jgi:hypothetical protein
VIEVAVVVAAAAEVVDLIVVDTIRQNHRLRRACEKFKFLVRNQNCDKQ